MKSSLKLFVSAVAIAVLAPFLWNCVDFSTDEGRFWLLDPNINNQRTLLPFTYSADLYYNYGWMESDTGYMTENVGQWKSMLGGNVSARDIHNILYYTAPQDFFEKKYPKKNSFIATLAKPVHAKAAQYLNFSKNCEAVFNTDAWDNKKVKPRILELVDEGKKLLSTVSKDPQLNRRYAYQLLKLQRLAGQNDAAKTIFEQYFLQNQSKDWLQAAAYYQNAELQPDSTQANIWLARAWDAGFYNPIWLWHSFNEMGLKPALKSANATARDKAVMTIIPATRKPGPALNDLKEAYQYDPSVPGLSKLLSREVNKLENWLLSPTLYKNQNRIETQYKENTPAVPPATLLKSDLEHLHACRAFVQQVMQDNKRPDMPFWALSAAHLAYLDQDFKSSLDWVQKGQQLAGSTPNQKIQLQLIALLAEIGSAGQIPTATEDKIPGLFQAIRQNKDAFEAPDKLQERLAALLSDQFIRKGEMAKGAFLLGKTSIYTEGLGYMNARNSFEKLLESGSPADFDRAIEMVEHPKTGFERWFLQEPQRYNAQLDWDEKNSRLQPVAGTPSGWETDKLREFKAMWHTRRDQLDSALLALKDVPNAYWHKVGNGADYGHVYYKNNPFSTGIGVTGVPLSMPDTLGKYNKRTFLEKLIALRNIKVPEKQQEVYFLLGNAYYNMTYSGRDWWLMMATEKSSGELDYYIMDSMGSIPDTEQPSNPLWSWGVLGVFSAAFAGFSLKKGKIQALYVLLLLVSVPFSCKQNTPAAAKVSQATVTPFDDVYYRCTLAKSWYEKAIKINPDNDLGIASAYMAGLCEQQQQHFQFSRKRKNWEEEFKPGDNAFFHSIKGKKFQSPLSCSYLREKL